MCERIAQAYARLHERNVAHGDVHNQNVLIGRDGRVTLVDFGQPYLLDGSETHQQARGGVLSNYDPEMAAALLVDRHAPPATGALGAIRNRDAVVRSRHGRFVSRPRRSA
jgi:DNA-binding helix-hairpin-helix protein with protein kinase domain